jgi:hypothetical protein
MSFRSADLLRLINEHGENLTYASKSAATYDPVPLVEHVARDRHDKDC